MKPPKRVGLEDDVRVSLRLYHSIAVLVNMHCNNQSASYQSLSWVGLPNRAILDATLISTRHSISRDIKAAFFIYDPRITTASPASSRTSPTFRLGTSPHILWYIPLPLHLYLY